MSGEFVSQTPISSIKNACSRSSNQSRTDWTPASCLSLLIWTWTTTRSSLWTWSVGIGAIAWPDDKESEEIVGGRRELWPRGGSAAAFRGIRMAWASTMSLYCGLRNLDAFSISVWIISAKQIELGLLCAERLSLLLIVP